ncbi:LIC_10190 family membrane protein [Cytophaga aurantiaca]|uniref:LIC_10190 family membrane protein n=1 Tax=Cytophaga aurantiaca TaxID=29530 RepID=UPI00035CBE6D|nr:hypothetical protein [Cytophaga aurantiaca]
MIALFLSSFISLFLFISFGFFTTKIGSFKSNIFEKILIGFVIINTLTCLISIFIPITFTVTLSFIISAALITFYIKNELIKTAKSIHSNCHILLFATPFVVVGFYLASQEPAVFDSGLYHIQCIKWIEEYPTVPGLANLHHRFGFNPIVFSLYALTSLQSVFGQEIFCINLVLFSILTVYFIRNLFNTFNQHGLTTYFIFQAIFFYVLILLSTKISSPSPDYTSSVFLLFIFLRIIEIERSTKTITFNTFIPIILLSVYCIMAKLSSVPICLITGYILFTYTAHWKEVLRISIIAFAICIPWLINTVLLTGWLIYPFSAIDLFSFDWKVPTHIVHQANTEIVGWARSPNDFYYEVSQMPLTKWVSIWWNALTVYIKLLIIGSIVLPMLLFIGQILKIIPAKRLLNITVLTSVCGVVFWFFTAPDFRFGHIFILIACCSPLLYFNSAFHFFNNYSSKQKQLFFILVCSILLFKLIRNNYGFGAWGLRRTLSKNSILPEKINSNGATYTHVYVGNKKIYVPLMDERCFDHEIPCSYLDLSSIQLRGVNLANGFKPIQNNK